MTVSVTRIQDSVAVVDATCDEGMDKSVHCAMHQLAQIDELNEDGKEREGRGGKSGRMGNKRYFGLKPLN